MMLRLAAIGLGQRAMGMLKLMMSLDESVTLAGLVDPHPEKVRKALVEHEITASNVLVMDDVQSIIRKRDQFDGVIIGTRCHLHAPLAVEVAPAGLPVFLEKPVATSMPQLEALQQAYQGKESEVVVSFPLRVTPLFLEALQIVRSGRLGVINQIQAWNNVSYGDVYFKSWYRNFEQTGGLWLQKATHDVDYLNLLAGGTPVSVAAMMTRRIHDDPQAGAEMAQAPATSKRFRPVDCPIVNQDAGSATFMYDHGGIVNYNQNFVTRKAAGTRGCIVTGHKATLRFDWRDSRIRVMDHYKARVDDIEVSIGDDGHGGGDHALARNFIDIIQKKEASRTSLTDGILSAAMCLAARESANTHVFQPIVVPGKAMPPPGPRATERLETPSPSQP